MKILTTLLLLLLITSCQKKNCEKEVFDLNIWKSENIELVQNGNMVYYKGETDKERMIAFIEADYYVKLGKLNCD